MMFNKLPILGMIAVFAIGCNTTKAIDQTSKTSTLLETTGSSPSPKSVQAETSKSTPKVSEAKPKAINVDLPTELKHDGYRYLGLGSSKPLTMVITGGPSKQTGSQAFKLVKFEGGEATYRVETTGALKDLGEVEYFVRKDGVYARQYVDSVPTTKPQLQIPAKLTPGYKWNTKDEFSVQGTTVTVVQSNKILGAKTITVGGKSFSTILISSTGTMSESGMTSKIDTKMWLVKDRGQVKVEIVRTVPNSKPVKLTITTI
jgi:hypothetical protein